MRILSVINAAALALGILLLETCTAFTLNGAGQVPLLSRTNAPTTVVKAAALTSPLFGRNPDATKVRVVPIRRRFQSLKIKKRLRHVMAVVMTALVWRGGVIAQPPAAYARQAAPVVEVKQSNNRVVPAIATVALAAGAGTVVARKIAASRGEEEEEEPETVATEPAETKPVDDEKERLKAQQIVENVLRRLKDAQRRALETLDLAKPQEAAKKPMPTGYLNKLSTGGQRATPKKAAPDGYLDQLSSTSKGSFKVSTATSSKVVSKSEGKEPITVTKEPAETKQVDEEKERLKAQQIVENILNGVKNAQRRALLALDRQEPAKKPKVAAPTGYLDQLSSSEKQRTTPKKAAAPGGHLDQLPTPKGAFKVTAASPVPAPAPAPAPAPVKEEPTVAKEDKAVGKPWLELAPVVAETAPPAVPKRQTHRQPHNNPSSHRSIAIETHLSKRAERALKQPKSPSEEKTLQTKYASIDSLEERAFAILVDLGMVELTPDPEDPRYNHAHDTDFAEDNDVFQ